MKKDLLTLDVQEMENEEANMPHSLGVTFSGTRIPTSVPVEVRPAPIPAEAPDNQVGWRLMLGNFIKPTFSNFVFLGCLLGLFALYCCSCVIHALTIPTRKKAS